MTEETAIRIAEILDKMEVAIECSGLLIFFAICLAIVVWAYCKTK